MEKQMILTRIENYNAQRLQLEGALAAMRELLEALEAEERLQAEEEA